MKLIRLTHHYPLFFHKIPKAYHNNTPLKNKNQNKMQTKTTKNTQTKPKYQQNQKPPTTPPKQVKKDRVNALNKVDI